MIGAPTSEDPQETWTDRSQPVGSPAALAESHDVAV